MIDGNSAAEREYQRQQDKELTPEQLDEMTANAVKGFDLSLKQYFIDAIVDTDFSKFMECMENCSGVRGQFLAYKAASRLYQELYDKTRAHIESEFI